MILLHCDLYISDAKKPTVAAVEGLALGGGLEVTLVCGLCLVVYLIGHNFL